MKHLNRYTPEICSALSQIAEQREWRPWEPPLQREEILDDLELTYHLHSAAQAAGARAGLPAMPGFPIDFSDTECVLDPVAFIRTHINNVSVYSLVNQLDSNSQPGLAA